MRGGLLIVTVFALLAIGAVMHVLFSHDREVDDRHAYEDRSYDEEFHDMMRSLMTMDALANVYA